MLYTHLQSIALHHPVMLNGNLFDLKPARFNFLLSHRYDEFKSFYVYFNISFRTLCLALCFYYSIPPSPSSLPYPSPSYPCRYIPDISRALLVVMMKIKAKEDIKNGIDKGEKGDKSKKKKKTAPSSSSSSSSSSSLPYSVSDPKKGRLLGDIAGGLLTESILAAKLGQAVDR